MHIAAIEAIAGKNSQNQLVETLPRRSDDQDLHSRKPENLLKPAASFFHPRAEQRPSRAGGWSRIWSAPDSSS